MIPQWTADGLIPPIQPNQPGHSLERSPYLAELHEVVEYFAISPERRNILRGFLKYREQLYASGITVGFQWLDGSFVEHIEILESRPPRDIDVVTFFQPPPGETQESLYNTNPDLFKPGYLKAQYQVDGYYQELGKVMNINDVGQVSYWYSMWSHRRTGTWKGFVQVNLDPNEDKAALALLKVKEQEGAWS